MTRRSDKRESKTVWIEVDGGYLVPDEFGGNGMSFFKDLSSPTENGIRISTWTPIDEPGVSILSMTSNLQAERLPVYQLDMDDAGHVRLAHFDRMMFESSEYISTMHKTVPPQPAHDMARDWPSDLEVQEILRQGHFGRPISVHS